MMSMIRSKGTLVNKEITSKETRLKSSRMCKSDWFFYEIETVVRATGRNRSLSLRIRFYVEMKLNYVKDFRRRNNDSQRITRFMDFE